MQHMPYQPNKATPISRLALSKADYAFSSSFFLSMPDHQQPLICEEIVRIIPGKRMVTFGYWNNKAVVIKIFFSRLAKQHLQRDLKGMQALIAAKIPTPPLHYAGETRDATIHVIVSERIAQAESLEVFWQKNKNTDEGEEALRALTVELATQHVLGLVQEDLHLKNFLVTPGHIYTIDGANIQITRGPLSKRKSLENLALFFSQLGIHSGKLQQKLFRAYVSSRSWLVKKADISLLETSLRLWSKTRWQRYRKKIFRSSTQFNKTKTLNRYSIVDREYLSPLFEQFLLDPDPWFNHPDTLILKAGRTSTVAKITLGQRSFVVKRYNIKNSGHALRLLVKPSRAVTSWRLAHQLQFNAIPTAKPIAFLEKRFLGLRRKSYFVMEYVEGARADHFFESPSAGNDQNVQAAKQIISLFFNLAQIQLCHGDLKITNILLNQQQEPVLIDLDSMREHHWSLSLWKSFRKDMQRFLENWHSKPSLHQLFQRLITDMGSLKEH